METKVITSTQFKIAWRDIVRSALFSAVTTAVTVFQQSIDGGAFNFKFIGMAAVGSFVGKILIAFFQPDKVVVVPGSDSDLKDTAKQIKRVI